MNYAERQRLLTLVSLLACAGIFSIGGFGLVVATTITAFQHLLPVSIATTLVGILWGSTRWIRLREVNGLMKVLDQNEGARQERNKNIAG